MKPYLRRALGKAAIALPLAAIRLYQLLLSPWCGYCCRFQPSCSHYAAKALCDHGLIRGCVLTARRLLRCHPWGGKGFDPVPEKN